MNWSILLPDPMLLNWLAILVAALTAFIAGAVWYTVIFVQAWPRYHMIPEQRLAQLGRYPIVTFSIMLLAYAAMATVLDVLVIALNISKPLDGALLGLLIGVGIAMFITLVENRLHRKPLAAFLIDGSFQIIVLTLIGAIVASWR